MGMTLREAVVKAIEYKFKNTTFLRKGMIDRYIKDQIPTIQNFSIEHNANGLVDTINIVYADCVLQGHINWRNGTNGICFVLDSTELVDNNITTKYQVKVIRGDETQTFVCGTYESAKLLKQKLVSVFLDAKKAEIEKANRCADEIGEDEAYSLIDSENEFILTDNNSPFSFKIRVEKLVEYCEKNMNKAVNSFVNFIK